MFVHRIGQYKYSELTTQCVVCGTSVVRSVRAKHITPCTTTLSRRKIYAGKQHYAVLPLSFVGKSLQFGKSARHDCWYGLVIIFFLKSGKDPCQTDQTTIFILESISHAFCTTKCSRARLQAFATSRRSH